ncbi:uncharacterized protein ACN2A1_006007 isoform 1-T1 [Glossina fuscipes fuscipes]
MNEVHNKPDDVTTISNGSDFETAIAACGFGAFNVVLLLVSALSIVATVFTSSTISYILPTAECDLHLSLIYKGLLNGIAYAGMIISAIPWGFVADTIGRRQVMISGLLFDAIFVTCCASSQNVQQLLTFKFFDGAAVSGPFAVVMSYLSEFHGFKHRPRIMMIIGMMKSLATLILPIIAYVMLPYHIAWRTDYLRLHTWHFFLMVSAIPTLLGGVLNIFLPESPKFLMSQGRNEDALKSFRVVYAMNKRKPKSSYPITQLVDEDPEKSQLNNLRNSEEYRANIRTLADKRKEATKRFLEGLKQMQPMCAKPYFGLSVQVYFMLFCILLSLNTIRLWLPQLFATMVEYEQKKLGVGSMCAILNYSLEKTKLLQKEKPTDECDVHITPDSYTNNIIVAGSSFCGYFIATFTINRVGSNNVLRVTLAIGFVSGITLYWSYSSVMTLVIACVFITALGVSSTTLIGVSVNLFPTSMRTMVVIMCMTFGRFGSLLGNLLFPYFISLGCIPPFVFIGTIMFYLLKPANFEEAIDSAGFGLFNCILILITILCSTANIFSSTAISYILPIAECDLKLTLLNKGALNAVTYAGMITSAIVWGYLADTQGRKKILVIGCLADAISSACCSLSQNFQMLIVFKFIEGFAANGPCAVLFTYLTEFHNAKNRPRLSMILGLIQSFASLILPMLAWLILPQDWDFITQSSFKVHTWQIFLFICGLPSLLSGIIFLVLPESPKFLMSQGRNTEALNVFQQIYAVNRRQSKDLYPIRQLIEEVPSRDSIHIPSAIFTVEGKSSKLNKSRKTTSFKQSLHDGWLQMRPMFHKPLLSRSLHVYLMLFALLLGLNSIRLWLPQLFASISKYEALHTDASDSTDLCTIVEFSVNKTQDVQSYTSDCSAYKNISMDMYLNNIIVAVIGLLGYFCAMFIIRVLGPKRLANYSLFVAALFGIGLYWSTDSLATLIISALFVNISSIATASLNGLILTLFPTTLRTSVASLSMMFGRLGSLSGNLLFPIFMEYGCLPPFLMVSSMTIFASILSCLLPKETDLLFL